MDCMVSSFGGRLMRGWWRHCHRTVRPGDRRHDCLLPLPEVWQELWRAFLQDCKRVRAHCPGTICDGEVGQLTRRTGRSDSLKREQANEAGIAPRDGHA